MTTHIILTVFVPIILIVSVIGLVGGFIYAVSEQEGWDGILVSLISGLLMLWAIDPYRCPQPL